MIQFLLHGAHFDMASGECVVGHYEWLRTFPLRQIDGWIEVAVPDERPSAKYQPARG